MPEEQTYRNSQPFLLMEGGPLFHIEQRIGTILRRVPFTRRRALLSIAVTWCPLFLLSLLQGTAYGHAIPVPFLHDFSIYTRYLLAVPLLLLSENILGLPVAETAQHFITSNVVLSPDYSRFDEAIVRGLRRRDSAVVEVVILVLAVILSIAGFLLTAVHASTWYATRSTTGITLTWAGWWNLCVCLPLYHFLVIRLLWRLILWFSFLATMNHLHLQLVPTHPDRAGGLGFVGETQAFFGIIPFAFSCAMSGVIANEILYNGVRFQSFAPAIAGYVVVMVVVLVAPLAIFALKLLRTKRRGLHEYGTFAMAYTSSFHCKWILGQNPQREPLLGTGDIQSLADLGNSFELVQRMRILPIEPRILLNLLIAGLLPMAPLLLTVMPFKEVLKLLMKIVA